MTMIIEIIACQNSFNQAVMVADLSSASLRLWYDL